MEPIVRTIHSGHLQSCQMLRLPFNTQANSTLNQKFNIQNDYVLAANEYPTIGYLAIGNRGLRLTTGADGFVLTEPVQHLPRHSALYNHIPFIVRTIDNDLSAVERTNYRLRVPFLKGGVTYVAYYIKVLDKSNTLPAIEVHSVDTDGSIVSSPFTPTASDLSPEPPPITANNVANVSGDYLVSTSKIPFILTANEVTEIMDACRIIYDDERYAVISEIALCTGLDKSVSGIFGGITSNYTEVVACQIAVFFNVAHILNETTRGIDAELDVGSVEPLIF